MVILNPFPGKCAKQNFTFLASKKITEVQNFISLEQEKILCPDKVQHVFCQQKYQLFKKSNMCC